MRAPRIAATAASVALAGAALALWGPITTVSARAPSAETDLVSAQASLADPEAVAADLTGDGQDDLFVFERSASTAYVVVFEQGPDGAVTWTSYPIEIPIEENDLRGHQIVAGNFDGDEPEELIWHTSGATERWDFTNPENPAEYSAEALDQTGSFQPFAGDFTNDGIDDVFWYGPDGGTYPVWVFDQQGGHLAREKDQDGGLVPVVGSFGTDSGDDVLWYTPGGGSHPVWDFTGGDRLVHESESFQADGSFAPFGLDRYGDELDGNDSVFWYGLDTDPDHVWDFLPGVLDKVDGGDVRVDDDYRPTPGDLLGDRSDDILWLPADGQGEVHLWDYYVDAAGQLAQRDLVLQVRFWAQRAGTAVVAGG